MVLLQVFRIYGSAGGANLIEAMRNNDFERAAKSITGTAKGIVMESAKKAVAGMIEGLSQKQRGQ